MCVATKFVVIWAAIGKPYMRPLDLIRENWEIALTCLMLVHVSICLEEKMQVLMRFSDIKNLFYLPRVSIFFFPLRKQWGGKKKLSISEKGKKKPGGEQDGRGVGGHGVHLSPWIHQEHTFRHRSAWRTPAESGQEDLSSGKEYIEPHKTR